MSRCRCRGQQSRRNGIENIRKMGGKSAVNRIGFSSMGVKQKKTELKA
jgi:hypothetical protein